MQLRPVEHEGACIVLGRYAGKAANAGDADEEGIQSLPGMHRGKAANAGQAEDLGGMQHLLGLPRMPSHICQHAQDTVPCVSRRSK